MQPPRALADLGREPIMAEALKPCPFCGSTDDMLQVCDTRCEGGDGGAIWISCNICECEGPAAQASETLEGAVEGWNQRHPHPSAGDAEALRDVLRDARLFVDLVHIHWKNMGDQEQADEATDCLTRIDAALADLDGAK